MENDFCQNHLYHNYNMLITYFIKEVDYGSRLKSCLHQHLGGSSGAWPQPPAHSPTSFHFLCFPFPPFPTFLLSPLFHSPLHRPLIWCHQQWWHVPIFKLIPLRGLLAVPLSKQRFLTWSHEYSVVRITEWWAAKPSEVLQCCSFLTFRLLSLSKIPFLLFLFLSLIAHLLRLSPPSPGCCHPWDPSCDCLRELCHLSQWPVMGLQGLCRPFKEAWFILGWCAEAHVDSVS